MRVESVGTYTLEVVTYGFSCDASASGEVVVGKYLTSMAEGLQWLGVTDGQMGMVFSEEWRDIRYRWFDATGRLVTEGRIPSGLGEVFIDAPGARGWLSLKLTSADGQQAIWSGIH